MLKRVVLVALLATAAVVGAPFAANAALYPPTGSTTTPSDSTPAPGDTVTITVSDGTFTSGESVTGSITGDPDASISTLGLRFGTQSTTGRTANTAGGISFQVVLPSNAQGSYTFNAVGLSAIANPTTLTVTPADGGGGGKELSYTGGQFPFLTVWVAAGALAIGAGLIFAFRMSRRKHGN